MSKKNGAARVEPHETSEFMTTSVSLPRELLEDLYGAMHAILNSNRSGLITEAVERLVLDLRKRHNGGKPFPHRDEPPNRRRNRSRFNLTPDR